MTAAACLSFFAFMACNNAAQQGATDSTTVSDTGALIGVDTQIVAADGSTAKAEITKIDSAGILKAAISVQSPVKGDAPVILTFTVENPSDTALAFCKWHTAFEEAFTASWLEITDSKGQQVQYKGVMAKRIMPPPAETYIVVPAKGSVTHEIDLRKGYDLAKPGKYKAVYQGQGVSNLNNVKDVTFELTK